MEISETKKQVVIDNYFKNTCDVNTSIKEAFTKGFEVGLTKAVFPKDQYEARLKADMVAMLTDIQLEIEEYDVIGNHSTGSYDADLYNGAYSDGMARTSSIIQQKIDALKMN